MLQLMLYITKPLELQLYYMNNETVLKQMQIKPYVDHFTLPGIQDTFMQIQIKYLKNNFYHFCIKTYLVGTQWNDITMTI